MMLRVVYKSGVIVPAEVDDHEVGTFADLMTKPGSVFSSSCGPTFNIDDIAGFSPIYEDEEDLDDDEDDLPRDRTHDKFDVVLHGYSENQGKIGAIKGIRDVTGLGLKESKALAEQPKAVILRGIVIGMAVAAVGIIAAQGGIVAIVPSEVR